MTVTGAARMTGQPEKGDQNLALNLLKRFKIVTTSKKAINLKVCVILQG
jgi:ribosomal protein L17